MARLARVVLPGYPHHIIQRGNWRQDVFFRESGYEQYLELLKIVCKQERIEIWAYCLMTNHVHLIVKPNKQSNLGKAIGEIHRRYTCMINFRENWKTYLKEAQGYQSKAFEQHERTGRPLGSERFIERAERLLNRELKKKKPRPKGDDKDN